MSAARDRLARVVNAYVSRRLQPLQDELAGSRAEVRELRAQVDALNSSLAETRSALMSTLNMLSRRGNIDGPVRCLFLVHYMEAWDSLGDVYTEMYKSDDFQPIVASIPRRLVHAPDFGQEELTHQRLEALGVPHIRLQGPDSFRDLDTVKQLDPHLIFRQSQWDADVPPAFATDHLSFARLALVPYETMSLIEAAPPPPGIRDWLTDTPYHRNCWAVFCANEYVRDIAAGRSVATNGEQFVVTGHPKVTRIRRAVQQAPARPRPFTVLWSAHHSLDDEWSRFGTFHLVHEQMLDWAAAMPEWHFVFSPHPSLTSRMNAAHPPLTTQMVESFRARWAALPNTTTFLGDAGGGYADMFAVSDVLVSDGLSLLLEYQIANKPVVFLERVDHRPFSPMGDIAQRGFHTVATVPDARAIVGRFAAGEPDPLAPMQREVVQELFGEHDPAREIVDHIRAHWRDEATG